VKKVEFEIRTEKRQLRYHQRSFDEGAKRLSNHSSLQFPHREKIANAIGDMNNPAPSAKCRNSSIKGAGTIKREGNNISLFRQDPADRLSIADIESRDFKSCYRAEFIDQVPNPIQAYPALVDDQAKPKVIDPKMSNTSDQLLKLNLFACDGNELAQRFFSRLFVIPSQAYRTSLWLTTKP